MFFGEEILVDIAGCQPSYECHYLWGYSIYHELSNYYSVDIKNFMELSIKTQAIFRSYL